MCRVYQNLLICITWHNGPFWQNSKWLPKKKAHIKFRIFQLLENIVRWCFFNYCIHHLYINTHPWFPDVCFKKEEVSLSWTSTGHNNKMCNLPGPTFCIWKKIKSNGSVQTTFLSKFLESVEREFIDNAQQYNCCRLLYIMIYFFVFNTVRSKTCLFTVLKTVKSTVM